MDPRTFRLATLFAWVMVGVPMLFASGALPLRLAGWVAAWLVFAVAAWWAARRPHPALLAVESLAVVTMVALLCNGYEGALLVIVAMQLGRDHAPRSGLVWIGVHTVAYGAAIAYHWSLRPALLLAPPYLGLQVLGYTVVRLLGRVEAIGRLHERLRIARDLHDAVGHHLTALSLHLEAAAHTVAGPAAEPVRTSQSIAKLLLAEVRDVVGTLERGGVDDVAGALRRLADEMPSPRVHLSLPAPLAPPREVSLVLLRCAQEIVTNAARHARAENLWIDVTAVGERLELCARDDGAGAEVVLPGTGLRGLRARVERLGGTLEVATSPGAGFTVRATLPGRAP